MEEADQQSIAGVNCDITLTLIRENIALLAELLDQLRRLDDGLFARECADFGAGQTIGRHCRHICDHYDALLRSIDSEGLGSSLRVDYDERARCLDTEQHRSHCIRRLEGYERLLKRLSRFDAEYPVHLSADVHIGSTGRVAMLSSLGRELAFLASHTTHHCALVAVLLQSQSHEPAWELGRAAATRLHEGA
ncbi:MAG: hypothetical protein AAGI11_20850 [Pseudomonadota bacterium]